MMSTILKASERKPFLLQSRIEDAIIAFFRNEDTHRRDFDATIEETTIDIDGAFDAYALAVAIERVVDETMAEEIKEELS